MRTIRSVSFWMTVKASISGRSMPMWSNDTCRRISNIKRFIWSTYGHPTNLDDFLTKALVTSIFSFDCTASDSLKLTKCVGYRCLYGLRVPSDMGRESQSSIWLALIWAKSPIRYGSRVPVYHLCFHHELPEVINLYSGSAVRIRLVAIGSVWPEQFLWKVPSFRGE